MTIPIMPEYPFDLADDEHIVTYWKPKFYMYLLRFSIEPVVIFVIIALYKLSIQYSYTPLSANNMLAWLAYTGRLFVDLIGLFILAAFYSYVSGSYDHWYGNKNKLYYLTDKRFVITSKNYGEENISIPLSSINKVQNYFYWKMFVRPYGSGFFEVSYLPKVKDVIKAIMHQKLNK